MGDNKKGFFKYANEKGSRANTGPILGGDGHLTKRDIDIPEMFNTLFCLCL